MQLDQTNIVIRERSASDTLDITLFVVRRNFGRLLTLLALGAAPFAMLNYLAVGWMLEVDPRDYTETQITGFAVRHYLWMTALIVIEAPLATALITRYLGDYVFEGKTPIRQVLSDVAARLPALLYVQGALRLGFAAFALLLLIDADNEVFVAESFLVLVLLANLLIRGVRPYVNELVILERKRFFGVAAGELSAGVRSARLHSEDSSAMLRFFVGCAFAVFLTLALINLTYTSIGVLFGDWSFSPIVRHVVAPLACWLSAGFVSVTRFLNYLNRRIENEGWEIELRVKAEAARLFAEPTGGAAP